MSSANDLDYVGICVRLRDGSAFLEVRAQSDGSSVRELPTSSHRLFPPHGEVELKGIFSPSLKPGDWAAFQVAPYGPPGQTKFRASEWRRLLVFEDLSHLGSGDAARRLYVEEGRAADVPGEKMIRIGDREMVRIHIDRDPDGRWRAVRAEDMGRLPIWLFDSKHCLLVPLGSSSLLLLDTKLPLQQIGTVNWSNDAEIVRRIVKSLARTDDGEDKALRQFAEALMKYADGLEGGASAPNAIDPFVARDVLRFRNLAALLKDQQDVLKAYFDVLRVDPEVKALIEARISALIQETVAVEKAALIEKLAAELEEEFAVRRAQREAELGKSVDELSAEMMNDLEQRVATRSIEIDTNLADLEKQGLDTLEVSLGRKRAELDSAVSDLARQRAMILDDVQSLKKKQHDLSMVLEDLASKEARALETVERLTRVRSDLEVDNKFEERICSSVPQSALTPLRPTEKTQIEDLAALVAKCSLLTEKGKKTLLRFIALLLAGEIPLLRGSECDDFIEIAQALISGGRCVRLEADPTIISFDDLWIRPGTQAATSLRYAAVDASGEDPRTQLCVISRADRSGARFWYPALAERIHRGDLPGRLFICVTLADPQSEEAKAFSRGCVVIDLEGVIAPNAAVVAFPVLKGSTALLRELEPGDRANDLTSALQMLAGIALPLRIHDAERLARIHFAAGMLLAPKEVDAFTRDVAAEISAAHAPTSSVGTPNRNVVPLGGAGRA